MNEVETKTAWLSKINWGELVKFLAVLLAAKGINVPPDIQNDIVVAIVAIGGIYTFVMRTWFTTTITPSSGGK